MKLALIIPSLGGGGAERVMATLASAWAADGIGVTLITLAPCVRDRYSLHPAVERIALDAAGMSPNPVAALYNNVARIQSIRHAFRMTRPDAIISFTTTVNLLVMLATTGLRVPVIVSERAFVGAQPPRGMWRFLYRWLYRRAAAVVAQTHRGAADLEARVKRPVTVIPNPVRDCASGPGANAKPGESRSVLAAGRLDPQKGFDILIDAFAMVAASHRDWRLRIMGEGPARAALTAQIAQRGLGACVSLSGFDEDLQASMRGADLFVLSSRYEGMPNVLLEAMSLGLACISSDCDTGPRELIDHGENGWLVPAGDIHALASALDTLIRDEALRKRLGERATKVKETYSLESVIARWNALLAAVAIQVWHRGLGRPSSTSDGA